MPGLEVPGSRVPVLDGRVHVSVYHGSVRRNEPGRCYDLEHVRAMCRRWVQLRFVNHESFATFTVSQAVTAGPHEPIDGDYLAVLTMASPLTTREGLVTDLSGVEDALTSLAGHMAEACGQTEAQVYFNGLKWRVECAAVTQDV